MHNQNTFVHTLRNHLQSHCDQLSFATFYQQILLYLIGHHLWFVDGDFSYYNFKVMYRLPWLSKDSPGGMYSSCAKVFKKSYRDRIVKDSNLLRPRFAALTTELFGFWPKRESNPWPANYAPLHILLVRIQSTLHYGAIQKLSTMDLYRYKSDFFNTLLWYILSLNNFLFLYHHWRCKGKSTVRNLFA